MKVETGIVIQAVAVTSGGQEKTLLKKLRATHKLKYELALFRDDQVVRYASESPGLVGVELVIDLVRDQFGESVVGDGSFTVIAEDMHGKPCVFLHKNWVCISLKPVVEGESPITIGEVFSFAGVDTGDVKVRLLSSPREIDKNAYALSGFMHEVKVQQKRILSAAGVGVVLACFGYIWQEVTKVEQQIIRQEKIVYVDKYEGYKNVISEGVVLSHGVVPSVEAITMLSGLPDGWRYEGVTYSRGLVSAGIVNAGGSVSELEHFRYAQVRPSDLSVNGQSAGYAREVHSSPSLKQDWTTNIVAINELRNSVIDVFVALGASVMSNSEVSKGSYSEQSFMVSFVDVPAYTLISGVKIFDGMPIVLRSVNMTERADSRVSAEIEFVIYGVK